MEQQSTKERLGSALKGLLCKRSLEKITVSDITAECGMGRQSFYYHFRDKYALLEWVIQADVERYVARHDALSAWPEYIPDMLRHFQKEKRFYTRVVNGQSELIFRQYSILLEKIIRATLVRECGLPQEGTEQVRFAARFFSYGLAGVLVKWIEEGMKVPPEDCIRHLEEIGMDPEKLSLLLRGSG